MLNVTLDMNCIINLEEGNANAHHIKKLVQMNKDGKINLRIVAISASERKPDETYASNFSEFEDKITAAGLGDVEILKPPAYFDVSFFDWCIFSDEQMEILERKIHEVLFPNIEFEYGEFCKKHGLEHITKGNLDRRWLNAKCDVLTMWCHIWYHGDIFVTRDNNFHKATKKTCLIVLGAGEILKPDEVVTKLKHVLH